MAKKYIENTIDGKEYQLENGDIWNVTNKQFEEIPEINTDIKLKLENILMDYSCIDFENELIASEYLKVIYELNKKIQKKYMKECKK